jgi:hypothetical protein
MRPSELVSYFLTCVDSWFDTQLWATAKIKIKARTRIRIAPRSVSQAGNARSLRFFLGGREPPPEERPLRGLEALDAL